MIVKKLKDFAADRVHLYYEARDKNHWTPLHVACHEGELE
jgi:ankyrin repeat protein